ncbi:MAG TPA: hypothetical protein VJN95_17825 [Gemmatimonadales bacterium]|nr:hypothetical protein [Gemmatimonadales bacterium]
MKRLTSGALLLGAVLVAASCNNVTGDLAQGATRVTVDPNPIAITRGKIGNVLVQNFDDQSSALLSAGQLVDKVGGAGPGGIPVARLSIVVDTNYQHGAVHYATQFALTADTFGFATARFSDAGLTTTYDTIYVVPNDSNPSAVLSNSTPNPGDTLTITISDPFRLDPASTVTITPFVLDSAGVNFIPAKTPAVLTFVDIAPDSLSMRVIAPDTTFIKGGLPSPQHFDAPAAISSVHIRFNPTLMLGNFHVQTTTHLKLP